MTPHSTLDLTGLRVLDGGMATELEAAGCDLSGPLWSASILETAPGRVKQVHAQYLEAGADALLTASYQVSEMGFRELCRTEREMAKALRHAVALAAEARAEYARRHSRKIWIGASLGPYGAALHNGAEYHGQYRCSFADLVHFHEQRVRVLAETDADFFAFETIPSLEEAAAILEALRAAPETAAYVSFTCRDGERVAHGEQLADCARLLEGSGQIIAVGVNCTAPRLIEPLIQRLNPVTSKRIAVYPNSGEEWDAEARSWWGPSEPAAFGELAAGWRQAGADWIGGCCRTGPAHIRAVTEALAGSR